MRIRDVMSEAGWRGAWAGLVSGLDDDALRLRFFSPSRAAALAFCETALPERLLIAEIGGAAAGAADVHVRGDVAEVGLCVSAAHRGRGVAGALVDAVISDPPDGAETLNLDFLPENAAVRAICVRRGALLSRRGGVVSAVVPLPRRGRVAA